MAKTFSPTDYHCEFQFVDKNGLPKEMKFVSRTMFVLWSRSPDFPDYLKWKDNPFAIMKSGIDGIGLFTDDKKVFSENDIVGTAFYKINSEGWFAKDYGESVLSTFINNSIDPNMDTLVTEEGIIFRANRRIEPLTELTTSYQALIEKFPRDPGVKRMLQYW